jgi:hypothetical protein
MACKSSVALLYDMGGGKTTTMAHWAVLRGYRTVLIVTPGLGGARHPGGPGELGLPRPAPRPRLVSRLMAASGGTSWPASGCARRTTGARLRQRLADLLGLENGAMVEQSAEWGLPKGEPTLEAIWTRWSRESAALEARLQAEEAILLQEDRAPRLEASWPASGATCATCGHPRQGQSPRPEGIEPRSTRRVERQSRLTGRLLATYAALGDVYHDPANPLPDFYVTSYQDLSLGDHLGIFEPWDHDHFDRQGNYEGTVRGLRGARCTCNASRKSQIPACPQCGAAWRGEGDGGGRVCRACGHVAWTMGRAPKRPLPTVNPRRPSGSRSRSAASASPPSRSRTWRHGRAGRAATTSSCPPTTSGR